METKDKIKVLFRIDADGYIIGYQQEFFDGTDWQTPFDTTDALILPQAEIDSINLGASKLINGKIVVDQDKLTELQVETNKTTPTLEQSMINALGLQVAQLQAELAKKNGDGANV